MQFTSLSKNTPSPANDNPVVATAGMSNERAYQLLQALLQQLNQIILGKAEAVSDAVVCLLAIFAPSFLLVAGALPFWEGLRAHPRMRAALAGVNAAVVGLLVAALYQPVWTSAIHTPQDVALALLAGVALMAWKLPPWLVVAASAGAGWWLGA